MRNSLITGFIVANLLFGFSYANDNLYDSAKGISSDSHRAEQQSQKGIEYKNLNSPAESARSNASAGFDTTTNSNIGWGSQYIPIPKPKIDKP